MATVPQITGPDGVDREDLVFTTTQTSRFFTGTISSDTVDVQVSIRGAAYTSDPDFVFFEGTEFTIPNPSSFPDGLDLVDGQNQIQVRATDTGGSVSAAATALVTLVQESDLGLVVSPPANISLERNDGTVEIFVEGLDSTYFRGINLYASTSPGGGSTGYLPINVRTITDFTTTTEETVLATLPVTSSIALGNDQNPAADPLLIHLVATQVDEDGALLQTDFDESYEVPEDVRDLSYSVTVNRTREVNTYSFEHDRAGTQASTPATIPQTAFSSLNREDPIYYVATAIFYDPSSQLEVESSFTPEVQGSPLTVTTSTGGFPLVTRDTIVQDMAVSIFRSRPSIRIDPGSVTRDLVIDPAAQEFSQLRFILDFIHQSQSFNGLNRIDDPNATGSSVSVSQSNYKLALKQAFKLQSDTDVQAVIDQAYELQASRYGVTRRSGNRATGEVTFYTTRRPTATVTIPIGTIVTDGSRRFRTTEAASITLSNIASFFSSRTGRYSVRVKVQADQPGSSGNLAPTQIRTIVVGPTNLSVTNESRFFGGTDTESNRDLATRAIRTLSSVDSGTAAGLKKAAIQPGVSEVKIVTPGDVLMQRDVDSSGVHRGGKADVWIRGTSVNTVTDNFAFSFEIAQNVLFDVVGDPLDLRFRALDSRITEESPILEVLDYPTYNFGLVNSSTLQEFDLTNVEVEDYNVIKLDTSQPQPSLSLTDVVTGDVRFRTSNAFVLKRQPVTRINSLTGTVTGSVSSTNYNLVQLADPALLGRSTQADDYVQVVDDQSTATIPSGDPIVVTGESHVILGETVEYLNNLGANPITIQVWNADRTVEYDGPYSPSGTTVDFTIVEGDETTPYGIRRTDTGAILTGQELQIDYRHDENFVVSYDSNYVVTSVQESIDDMRHVTADVVVKESITTPVDIEATVVLNQGSSPSTVDGNIRTNLTNYIGSLGLGRSLRQSDVVGIIEGTTGVSYIILPLTKMVRSEDALILREAISSAQGSIHKVDGWSTNVVDVYLLEDEFANATTDGGGSSSVFRGVFEDDVLLDLQTQPPLSALGGAAGRSFIIGSDGVSIPGYSDDATLAAEGLTASQILTARADRTGNRVLVSLASGDIPSEHVYRVTYRVGVDSGVKNITPGATESLSLGTVVITYDEDSE